MANLDNTAFIDGEEDVISIDEEDVDMADDSDDKKSMEIVPVNDPMQITTNLSNAVDPMQITTNLPNAIQDVASPNTPIVATSVESHMQEHSKDIFKKRLLALAVEFPDYVKFDEVEKLISESAE